jgi:hypothetical protein
MQRQPADNAWFLIPIKVEHSNATPSSVDGPSSPSRCESISYGSMAHFDLMDDCKPNDGTMTLPVTYDGVSESQHRMNQRLYDDDVKTDQQPSSASERDGVECYFTVNTEQKYTHPFCRFSNVVIR